MNHHTELVGKIAHEVYQSLGSGFSEDVYDRAMQFGLLLACIEYESQKADLVMTSTDKVDSGTHLIA